MPDDATAPASTGTPPRSPDEGLAPARRSTWWRAVVQWLLGDVPELERRPESLALAILVCTVGATGMFLGTRRDLHGGPMPVGLWRMLVHGGLPLAAVGLWELRARWKAGSRSPAAILLALAGVALLLAPIVLRFDHANAKAEVAEPYARLLAPAALGAVFVVYGLKQLDAKLEDWGIGFGDWRWWLPHHGLLLLALIPAVSITTCLVPALAHYYPMYKPAQTSLPALEMSCSALGFDLFGWEFLFRGFLLFGVARRGDAWAAILLQALPFFLLHSPKPELEMISSFVGAIFAGWFCLRARTFFPLVVIHVAIITAVSATAFWLRQ